MFERFGPVERILLETTSTGAVWEREPPARSFPHVTVNIGNDPFSLFFFSSISRDLFFSPLACRRKPARRGRRRGVLCAGRRGALLPALGGAAGPARDICRRVQRGALWEECFPQSLTSPSPVRSLARFFARACWMGKKKHPHRPAPRSQIQTLPGTIPRPSTHFPSVPMISCFTATPATAPSWASPVMGFFHLRLFLFFFQTTKTTIVSHARFSVSIPFCLALLCA